MKQIEVVAAIIHDDEGREPGGLVPVSHTVPAQCNLSIPPRSPLFSLKSLLSSKKLFIFAV